MNEVRYHVAAFAADGSFVGRGIWHAHDLSKKWLSVRSDMLSAGATSAMLRVPFEGLSHLEIKYTRSGGTGLATFYANAAVVTSSLFMDGANREADAEVQAMFLQSLRRSMPAARALGELTRISERPLHAVVSWGNPTVSAEDEELVRELSTHFAAALFGQVGS